MPLSFYQEVLGFKERRRKEASDGYWIEIV